jgi:hypothetical protein
MKKPIVPNFGEGRTTGFEFVNYTVVQLGINNTVL